MNKSHKLMAFLLLISCISCRVHSNFFDEVGQFIDHAHHSINKQVKRIKKKVTHKDEDQNNVPSTKSTKRNLSIEEKEGIARVIFAPIEATEEPISAEFNQLSNTLTITLSTGVLTITTRDHMLFAQYKAEKYTKDKIEYTHMTTSASSLQAHPQLAGAHISYESETKELVLTIPLAKETSPTITSIPVQKK